jgi:aspartate 1-decarboxylase
LDGGGVHGAAAHLAKAGDLVIIVAYAQMSAADAANWKPKVVLVDERNGVK